MVSEAIGRISSEYLPEILGRFVDIIKAPIDHPQMLWIIAPILIALIILQLYFARYRHVQNDYFSALSNAIFLIFVSADLLHFLANNGLLFSDRVKTGIAFLIIIVGSVLIIVDFFRLLPAQTIFQLSSKATFYFMSYIAIILVYTNILMQNSAYPRTYNYISSLIAVLLFYILFQLAITAIRIYVPASKSPSEAVLENTEEELEEIAHKAKEIKDKQAESSDMPRPSPRLDLEEEKKKLEELNKETESAMEKLESEGSSEDEIHSAISEAAKEKPSGTIKKVSKK